MIRTVPEPRTVVVVLTAAVSMAFASTAEAQPLENIRVGLVHGTVFYLNDIDPPRAVQGDEVEEATLRNSWGWGFEVGADLSDRLELEGYVLTAPGADLVLRLAGAPLSVGSDSRVIYAGGNLLYYFSPDGLRPFVEGGIGTASRDLFSVYGGTNNYRFAGNVGAGLAGQLTEGVSLRASLHNHISSYGGLRISKAPSLARSSTSGSPHRSKFILRRRSEPGVPR